MEIKHLGQLINSLALKAGILANDPALLGILSNAELTKVTVNGDFLKALDENLISMDAASDNHPILSAKYKSQALNPIDRKMEALMEQFGLDDAAKDEIKAVKSSYERLDKLAEKLKTLTEKKDGADTSKEKGALQKQIDDLLKKMQDEKSTYDKQLSEVQDERLRDKIGFELKSIYGGAKTIFDSLEGSVKASSLDAIINKGLQEKNAVFTYDDKGNFIVQTKEGATLLRANNTKYTPQELVDEILATNKVLAVNGNQQQHQNNSQNNQQQQGQQSRQVDAGNNGQQINGTNQSVTDFNLAAIESFGTAAQ